MVRSCLRVWLMVLISSVLLLGCKPFELERDSEVPQGPGLLSGDEGEFVIFSCQRLDTCRKAERK